MRQHVDVACDPLATLDEDYEFAVLHLAWIVARDERGTTRTLLCATAELLPTEVPPPEATPEIWSRLGRHRRVFARNVVVSAKRAVEWFEQAASGMAIRPRDDGSLPAATTDDAPSFVIGSLLREPPDRSMVLLTIRAPFQADWGSEVRARHLIPASSPVAGLPGGERAALNEWMTTEFGIDFDRFPEHGGSIHLVAPNPVFRELRTRRQELADGVRPSRC